MSILTLLNAAFGPVVCSALLKQCLRSYNFYAGWACSGIGGGAGYLQSHEWLPASLCLANALLAALCWWLSRRKRKRAAKLLGAKAKALRAALVRAMRERARPRRVLRPVPGGAW